MILNPGFRLFSINDRQFKTICNINRLSYNDLAVVYTLIDNMTSENLIKTRLAIACYLMRIDEAFIHEWRSHYEIDAMFFTDLERIVSLVTDFLFDRKEVDGKNFFALKLGLTRCPLPNVMIRKSKKGKIREHRLFGPAMALMNVTFEELAMCFTLVELWYKSENAKEKAAIIEQVLAVLFRYSKPNTAHNRKTHFQGDRREPLSGEAETVRNERAKLFKSAAKMGKMLLWWWFLSCREMIIAQNPRIFSDTEGGAKKPILDKLAAYSWAGVILELANNDLTKVKEIEATNYREAFLTLSYINDKEWTKAKMSKQNE